MDPAADDERMLRYLEPEPRSQAECIEALGWDYRKVNHVLTELRLAGRIVNEPPTRINRVKVTKYSLKRPPR